MATKPEVHAVSSLLKMRDPRVTSGDFFLQIPTFQRGLVWSDEKKRNLIASMYREFPIGSLLLYASNEKTADGKRNLAQIIDGLQRSTAILDYAAKPLKYAPVADLLIERETISTIMRLLQPSSLKITAKAVQDALHDWAIETEETKAAKGFQSSKLIQGFQKIVEVELTDDQVEELRVVLDERVIDHLSDKFKTLSEYKVPIIVYSGTEESLPEIFESLNSGTPLTKYDKFGATWSNYKVVTKTKAIRDAIRDRYSVYIEKGWEVQDFDATQDLGEEDLNLFEYLTGLGKVLSDEFKCLFSQVDKSSEPAATAFVLTTVAHGLRPSEMGLLPKKLGVPNVIDLTAFELALMDACLIVNQNLAELLALKLNQRNVNDRFLPHSDNQILSLVLRVLVEKYDVESWKPIRQATQLNVLLENVQVHYVKDILNEAWRGSGDSTLFERVWIKNDATNAVSRAAFYLQKPSRIDFEQALTSHHETELNKRQTNRGNLSTKSKLLLRVLYTDIISHRDNVTVQFDIEHLGPVKALSDLIAQLRISDGLPISCFGNLAILPTQINIIKGKNYVGDYIRSNPAEFNAEKIAKLDSYVIRPASVDISDSKVRSEAQYLDFVKSRFLVQKQILLTNLGY
jgi:hypothetical protein